MTCLGICYDWRGRYNKRPEQYVIYVGAYKFEDHKCGVTGYIVKREKICVYVISKCANCRSNHPVTIFSYLLKQKAQLLIWRNKRKRV